MLTACGMWNDCVQKVNYFIDHAYLGVDKDEMSAIRRVGWFICRTVTNVAACMLTMFLLWLILFRPYKVRPEVESAALTAFDLHGNALRYDLAVDVKFFNSHWFHRIRFNHLTTGLYYNGTKLGPSDDSDQNFKLWPRFHKTLHPVLRGRESKVSAAVAEQFYRERAKGTFSVDVWVKTTLTYKFMAYKAVYYYEYDCSLKFPAPVNVGTPSAPLPNDAGFNFICEAN